MKNSKLKKFIAFLLVFNISLQSTSIAQGLVLSGLVQYLGGVGDRIVEYAKANYAWADDGDGDTEADSGCDCDLDSLWDAIDDAYELADDAYELADDAYELADDAKEYADKAGEYAEDAEDYSIEAGDYAVSAWSAKEATEKVLEEHCNKVIKALGTRTS